MKISEQSHTWDLYEFSTCFAQAECEVANVCAKSINGNKINVVTKQNNKLG
jgi:hypothetical protein